MPPSAAPFAIIAAINLGNCCAPALNWLSQGDAGAGLFQS